jgi:hypothetical protein
MAEQIQVWRSGMTGLSSYGQPIDTPSGYVSVSLGDPFVTRKLKERAGKIYLRMVNQSRAAHSKPAAILAPKDIVDGVLAEAEASKERRQAQRVKARKNRQARESSRQAEIVELVKKQYPGMPDFTAEGIVSHAFEVGNGRVGRSSDVDLDEQIRLAVVAHIRHCQTDYDEILARSGERDRGRRRERRDVWEPDFDRQAARDQVRKEVQTILKEWERRPEPERGAE